MTRSFLTRYEEGEHWSNFDAEEQLLLAQKLQRTEAYRNSKHEDHEPVSREVQRIFKSVYPGDIGPYGEVVPK